MRLRVKKSRGRYYTYEVTLPKKLVEALGWEDNIELKAIIYADEKGKGILIKPSRE
jgi:bifunctional DNA-binding transcriptional regulator/antitoxin component of YhaV-PrlF toxin-antitoxin module